MNHQKQAGVVSLFVVIFTALLIMVISVGFIQLMTQNQQDATASDLSQNAYNSAQAGVEDAKRLLLVDQNCQAQNISSLACSAAHSAILSGSCSTIADGFGASGTVPETKIQQSEGDASLDQAYTCVKIQPDTADYQNKLATNQSDVIPLNSTGSYNQIRISWFQPSSTSSSVPLPTPLSLPVASAWPATYPPVLETQFIQTGDTFKLNDFDSESGQSSDANTLFLYPEEGQLGATPLPQYIIAANDLRRSPANTGPVGVDCTKASNIFSGAYSCSVILTLPPPIGGASNNGGHPNALLTVTPFYNSTSLKIELLNNGTVVNFHNVEPVVDSTGRANNLFRRVSARVRLESNFPYPTSALDVTGSLCKDFFVTNNPSDYSNPVCPAS